LGKTKNPSPQIGLRAPFTRNWFMKGCAKLTVKGWEKTFHTNTNQKKAGTAI